MEVNMGEIEESKVNEIISILQNLQYGSVVITVHDGEITQVDTTEKKRFPLYKKNEINGRKPQRQ